MSLKLVTLHVCLSLCLIVLSGCFNKENGVTAIAFLPVYNGATLGCDTEFIKDDKTWQLSQLLFFISRVKVQDKDGKWHALNLRQSSNQTQSIALLGSDCADVRVGDEANKKVNSKNDSWHLVIDQKLDFKVAKKMRFSLGIPFESNHENPLIQPSPLNDSSMFWVWQTGHKFLRMELAAQDDHWAFHLGSTGCKAPSALRAPNSPCLFPNVIDFEVELRDNPTIEFDLTALLNNIVLQNANSCQSEHDNATCAQLFSNLQNQNQNQNQNQTPIFKVKSRG